MLFREPPLTNRPNGLKRRKKKSQNVRGKGAKEVGMEK